MPDLRQSLKQHESHVLTAIQDFWQVELDADSIFEPAKILSDAILDPENFQRFLAEIPADAVEAIRKIFQYQNRMPFLQFFNLFGEIPVMGQAKFLREEPWKAPLSAAEWLWYHGVIQRGLFEISGRMTDVIFIPDDLAELFPESYRNPPRLPVPSRPLLIRPAAPREVAQILPGRDEVLDLICLLLAAVRTGNPIELLYPVYGEAKTKFIVELLRLGGILDEENAPVPDAAQSFLQMDRGAAQLLLIQIWQNAQSIDELKNIPEFVVDPLFLHDPVEIRRAVFLFLCRIQGNGWWSFQGFAAAVRQDTPAFLRNLDENTAWLIRNRSKSQFKDWENVEGVYLQYLIAGPFYWLGMIDIAYAANDKDLSEQSVSAFRINRNGSRLLSECRGGGKGEPARSPQPEKNLPNILIDGKITVTRDVSRMMRYQIARYCEWEKIQADRWQFRVTPGSLTKAKNYGLSVPAFLNLLKRAGGKSLPEALVQAIEQWIKADTQSTMFQATVLTVTNPDWIVTLMNSKDTAKWIEQRLNPNTILIKPKGEDAVRRALVELGVLTDKQN